jgi:RimJ/RimL family protein N-acetyltransferase
MLPMISSDLYTARLVRLAAPRPEDRDQFAQWSHDAEFQRLLIGDSVRPQSVDFYADIDKEKEKHNEYPFRVRTLEDDKLIGITHLGIQWASQVAWLAIGIGDPDYRNKGYGSDALSLTVNYGFRELGLYRISLTVFSYNTRAIRTYEKYGFVHEGAQRQALYRDGQRHDILVMGLLRPEWEQS